MADTPPRTGLTRINTGYRALPYGPGWYLTLEEVRNVQRRSDHRNCASNGQMAAPSVRTSRECKQCGATYTINRYAARSRCPECKRLQGGNGQGRVPLSLTPRKKGMSE